MTTLELLREYLDRERNNVFCCSANYLMDSPKRGYEREFQEAQEKTEILVDLIDRLERSTRRQRP